MYKASPITLRLFTDHASVDPVSEIFKALSDASECKPQRAGRCETVEPTYSQETQNDESFLDIDLPGVEKGDIAVEVRNRRLVVVGKRFQNDGRKLMATKEAADAAEAQSEEKQVTEERKPATGSESESAAQTEEPAPKNDTAEENEAPANAKSKRVRTKTYRGVFRLTPIVDVDAITVDYHRDGVLRLRLPHAKKQEPRKIALL